MRQRRIPPIKTPTTRYQALWNVIDSAVRDAFQKHPDYIPPDRRERTIRESIVKRVAGRVMSFEEQSKKSRSPRGTLTAQ